MKVFVKNFGEVTLNKNDYISSGGEGSIYAKNKTAYKIYTDPTRMLPSGKMAELAVLTNDNIIKPQDVVLDQKNNRIGYTMRFVQDTHALCQLFTKAFRERNNISHDMIRDLVKKLHNTVLHIHSHNILIVDCNEMNFLVSKGFDDIYAIDVDSYQTPHYPATALMESVRDRHTQGFNQNTDWFAFGIVSFQMFIGIHPYKGKHPTLMSLDDRMQKNVSVFNKNVGVPKVCYAFDVIPDAYKQWYKAVFEDGKRFPPPQDFSGVIHVITTVKKIGGSDNFTIDLIDEVKGTVLDVFQSGGIRTILTNERFYFNSKNYPISAGVHLAITNKTDTPILAKLDNNQLKLFNNETQKEITTQIVGSQLMTYQHRLYVKSFDSILEIQLDEIGQNILVAGVPIASVLENASKFYDGVLIQDLLGACFVSFFPTSKTHKQIHIKEFDMLKIVDAKYDSNVLMVVASHKQTNKYSRFVVRFAPDDTYDIREVANISPSGLNFVVLDNGTCICLNENEEIEIFSSKKGLAAIKIIDDPILDGDMRLFSTGGKVMFGKDSKLFSIKMK